jgi:hypothetical protein
MFEKSFVVGIGATLRGEQYWVQISVDAKLFFYKTFKMALRTTQPPLPCVPGFLPEDKRPESDFDHSPPSSAEVKNE